MTQLTIVPDSARPNTVFATLIQECVRDLGQANGEGFDLVDALLGGLKETIHRFSDAGADGPPAEDSTGFFASVQEMVELIGQLPREEAESIVEREFPAKNGSDEEPSPKRERLRARLAKLPVDLRALERKPRSREELGQLLAGSFLRFEPGQRTKDGNYELLRLLGSSESGEIWAARNLNNGEERALKFAASEASAETLRERAERFREMVAALGGALPGVARLESFQCSGDGAPYLVREYCQEGNLFKAFPPESSPPLQEILALLKMPLVALSRLHDAGHAHCDIEPTNILVKRTGPKGDRRAALLAGYGPPRAAVEAALRSMVRLAATAGSSPSGSFAAPAKAIYMAPEMRRGKIEADDIEGLKRCDVYAFGVTMAQALAGDPALEAGKLPRRLRKELPYGVMDLIAAATEHDPEDRPADASELLKQFKSIDTLLAQARWMSSVASRSSSSSLTDSSTGGGTPMPGTGGVSRVRSGDTPPSGSATLAMAPSLGDSSMDPASLPPSVTASHARLEESSAPAAPPRPQTKEERLEALFSGGGMFGDDDDGPTAPPALAPSPPSGSQLSVAEPGEDTMIHALLGGGGGESAPSDPDEEGEPGEDTMIHALLAGSSPEEETVEEEEDEEPGEDTMIHALLAGAQSFAEPAAPAPPRPREAEADAEEPSATMLMPGVRPVGGSAKGSPPAGEPGEVTSLDLGGGLLLNLARIPAGTFMMGSHLTEPGRKMNEGPHTRVTITQPFLISEMPISQAQWEAVMETTVADQRDKANPAWPLRGEGPEHPMYHVTWEEAIVFCNKLSRRFDMDISLPTEAQWERACRAGTDTPYFFGDDPLQLHMYAWRGNTFDRETHPLKRKKPNEWGLYDTLGNVWEWCLDQFGQYPGGARADYYNSADSAPSDQTPLRALRGGAWNRPPLDLRSASRSGFPQDKRASEVGFRVAASL